MYHIVPNKRACLNKRTPTFDLASHISGTTEPISMKFSGPIPKVFEGSGREFHCNRTRPWVRFLPMRPAHLFGTIWYVCACVCGLFLACPPYVDRSACSFISALDIVAN